MITEEEKASFVSETVIDLSIVALRTMIRVSFGSSDVGRRRKSKTVAGKQSAA